ncbi:NAD(P)H-binding protein [Yinghuangia sp. ASG 101]|uniref:NAD(P)H-binding protein n=1 Tax=Yinghuangia sp. ASG 101 TaxID=2896848 RepID=UPI0022B24AF1|nr:NAD(P)H-binding protein [Yinghuangia sp. ASG 101]
MFLITGATGTVGREAIDVLVKTGREVAAVTRRPAAAALPDGARVVAGDASDPATLASSLPDGIEAVLLSPRAVGGATAELLALAAARGARHVVVLSASSVEHPAGLRRFADEFKAVEAAAERSGLRWTFLRCADFDANALAWAPHVRATGVVRGAFGTATTSPIHQRDIAEAAVAAMVDPAHHARSYLLTGPEALDQYDKVRLIGDAIHRELSFVEVEPEQIRRAMLGRGLPEEIPDRMLGSLADYASAPGPSTDTVERLLGRPALSFGQWAAENAGAFEPPAGT